MITPTNRQECEKIFSENKLLKVVFTKKNGEERTMLCTRDSALIPSVKQPKAAASDSLSPRPPSETNFPVFDIEKDDWRAFTIGNLISVEEAAV